MRMTFDMEKVPGGDVARWGAECRMKALEGLESQDWRAVYDWTKSWIGWGGGAWSTDVWLLYSVSALLQNQPKSAVHSLDLGLRVWLEGPRDRAALTWCRGLIVWNEMKDPKTALLDLEASATTVPLWAAPAPQRTIEQCREAASVSRKRVPSVRPRPKFEGSPPDVAPAAEDREDGYEPTVWTEVRAFFMR